MNRKKQILSILLLVFACSVVYGILRSPKQERVKTLKYTPGSVAAAPKAKLPPHKSAAPAGAVPVAPAAPVPVATAPAATAPSATAPTATAPTAPSAAVPAASAKGAARPRGVSGDSSTLHLELLDREPPRSGGYRRNIFSPIFHEEVKVPPFKPLPPPPKPVKLPPPPPVSAQQGPPPMPPPPPPPTAEQIADQELAKLTFLGFLKKGNEKTVFLSSNNEIFLAKKGSKLGGRFEVTDITDDNITIRAVPEGRELVIPLVENKALRRTSKRTP